MAVRTVYCAGFLPAGSLGEKGGRGVGTGPALVHVCVCVGNISMPSAFHKPLHAVPSVNEGGWEVGAGRGGGRLCVMSGLNQARNALGGTGGGGGGFFNFFCCCTASVMQLFDT